jgi:cytochrome c oxidase assembly factor CtaG
VSSAIQSAVESWTPPLGTIAMLLLTAAIYARGFRRLHRQMPARFPTWRLAAFLAGIATILVAVASPLEELDDVLLQVHMTQHLMLMLAAPILLLAGAPGIALVRGIPPRLAKAVVGPLLRSGTVRRLFAWLTEPLVCWIAFAAATWGWHLPATFQLALRSPGWHVVEHACFFATGLMYWYPVIQPWPSVARWPRWTMIPYLILADGQNTILAALFMFSDRLIYPFYATAPRIAGFTPLGDQIVAGAIMWVPGSLFYLVPGAVIMLRMLAPQNLASPYPLRERTKARVLIQRAIFSARDSRF